MKRHVNRRCTGPAVSVLGRMLAVGLLAIASVPSHGAPPPAGKTYFTIFVGMQAPHSWDADCVRFTKTEMCYSDGTCGPWTSTVTGGQETAFAFEMSYYEDGSSVAIEGRARIEDRGKKDTLGAVGMVSTDGGSFNFALVGRSTGRRKCIRLLREWDPAGTTAQAD